MRYTLTIDTNTGRFRLWPAAIEMPGDEASLRQALGPAARILRPEGDAGVVQALHLACATATARMLGHDHGWDFAAEHTLGVVVDAAQLRHPDVRDLAVTLATRAVGTRVVLVITGDLEALPLGVKLNLDPIPVPA